MGESVMAQVVVAGGTGQVGMRILAGLAARADCAVTMLARRPELPLDGPNLRARIFDYDDAAAYDALFAAPCDVLFIALGTTLKQAGGAAGLRRVDHDYPVRLIGALARANPAAKVGLVSAVGADGHAVGAYLRAKRDLEAVLQASGLAHAIARPSFLLRDDSTGRPAEWLVNRVLSRPWRGLGHLAFPRGRRFWKWAPVSPAAVAGALLEATFDLPPGGRRILEGSDFRVTA
ncbi:MAG TPA: NAD(P)H-binding protein [Holophagaceae bacterium]|nr:NAD(P)H-binding protein [Holophagaceae bacterium]